MGRGYYGGEHFSRKFSFNTYYFEYNVRPNQVNLVDTMGVMVEAI